MRTSSWLDLALVFVPLSLISIGGGQAIIPEIHRQVVDIHHWLTETEFVTDYAISRMSPGPSSLVVTLIGWQVAGWLGALVATLAIYLPSSILVAGLARLWARYRGAAWQRAIEAGLAPIAAGMILAAALTLVEALAGGWLAWAVAVASTAMVSLSRLNPLLALAAGAAAYVLMGG